MVLNRARLPARAFDTICGTSAVIARLRDQIRRAATVDHPVLIRGQTGTGKELVARALHELGPRPAEPFVAVNCSAVPPGLFESQLFGHERGAFTGAERSTRGAFEQAGAGTILLDEIGDLPLELQPKLLRALETERFSRVGAETEMRLRARVIASTHVGLEDQIRRHGFREDLFHRLNVVGIRVPSLSEREEDLPSIIVSLARGHGECHFSPDAVAWLAAQHWPGNVRQLRNLIVRAMVFAPEGTITEALVRECVDDSCSSTDPYADIATKLRALPGSWPEKLEQLERHVVEGALRKAGGNVNETARLLGVERKLVARRLEKLRIHRPSRGG